MSINEIEFAITNIANIKEIKILIFWKIEREHSPTHFKGSTPLIPKPRKGCDNKNL